MITISQAIERVIAAHPTYGEALQEGIVNFSALARKMRPEAEEFLLQRVSDAAVVMALRRHAAALIATLPAEHVPSIRNITVRSDIVEAAFQSTANLNAVHRKLLAAAEKLDNPFLAYGQGTGETTFDMSAALLPELLALTKGESQIALFRDLAAISVRLPIETVTITGTYYPFVKALAWNRINVYQIITYFSELTFVVDDKDIEKAFAVMKRLAERSAAPAGANKPSRRA